MIRWSTTIAIASTVLVAPVIAQVPTALQVTHISSITSSTTCIDNRSINRQNNVATFTATGSGSWSVQMQFSNTSCAGPWTSYGTLAFLNQASSPMLGMGFDGRATYANFISFAITGSPTIDYAGFKNVFFPGGASGGSVSFPILVTQGGTGLTAGTSGGVPCFTSTTGMASSSLLTQNQLLLGGGAGACPSPLGSGGTTTTVLHGGGPPSFGQVVTGDIATGAVNLATQVSGTLPAGNLPGTLVYTGQANTYGAFLQDFTSATIKIPNSAGAAPVTSGLIAYDITANVFKGGVNGSTGVFPYVTGSVPVSGNCAQWGSGYALADGGAPCGATGANTSLSNLGSVSINSSLLAQTGIDLGSTSAPFRNLYIWGNGTFGSTSIEITGTPTASRVWAVQDASDTFVGRSTTDTLTHKTFNTAGSGNTFQINGTTITNISGNTATVATTSGSLINGHCPQFDINGNLVDSGSTNCGGSSSGLPDPGANGIVVRTALNTDTAVSIAAGTGITVTNANGTAGNPTVAITGLAVNAVSFSATPAYNLALGNVQTITLTGNVTGSSFTNAVAGQAYTFIICQDGTGSRTYTWGGSWHGGMTIGSTLSTCSAQAFAALNTTTLYAISAGVINQ